MAGDPVSWLVIEPGWEVVGPDGSEIGRVEQVVGDESNDIFSGLAISSGRWAGLVAKPKFVPAERVRSIREGLIEVDFGADAVDRLEEHEPAPPRQDVRP